MNKEHSGKPSPRYVIVSPVKDEERNIELTLRSVINQNVKPVLWIIVDDGSQDRTSEIVMRYNESHSFIQLVSNPNTGSRQPGSAVIRAFNFGCKYLLNIEYDFIVKLDCDMSFESDYFDKLLIKFSENECLGIASGVYLETTGDGIWKEVLMPSYHSAGACKVVRRECFEEIDGFVVSAGWDTVDEIRAMTRGWKSCHFADLRMYHHRREGSGIGSVLTSFMHGEIYYLTAGSKLFLFLKVIHRLSVKPYIINALALAGGYLRAMLGRKVLLVNKEEARYYQALLRKRISAKAKTLIGWN